MDDLTLMPDSDFYALHAAVEAEHTRRRTLQTAPDKIDQINSGVQAALGRKMGDSWVQPTGAHDAYPRAWETTHAGKRWASLIPANTTTPGSDPRWWKDLTPKPEPADPNAPKPWSGDYHAYSVGDLVTYNGQTYRVRQAHTSQPGWTPTAVPALYELVTT